MRRILSFVLTCVAVTTMAAQSSSDTIRTVSLQEVSVSGNTRGNVQSVAAVATQERINLNGLTRMACCNVGESFQNSAAVQVDYSDAVSGARQIKLLGLGGNYTQLLDEGRPMRGSLIAPFRLDYTPGAWLNAIQVTKGITGVTAGHEAITGQINLEYRKPADAERLFVNFYLDDMLRPELNLTSAIPITSDGSLSTIVMAHAAADTDWRGDGAMDVNDDGFRDMPHRRQLNVMNRWLWIARNGLQLRWGLHALIDDRTGGQLGFKHSNETRDAMRVLSPYDNAPRFGSHQRNRHLQGYLKAAMPLRHVVTAHDSTSRQDNIALVADYAHYDTDSYFGRKDYRAHENTFSANILYNHYFTSRSWLALGTQMRAAWTREEYAFTSPDYRVATSFNVDESELGAFTEYTLAIPDRLTVVAGARVDYNWRFGKAIFTPRLHVKWTPGKRTAIRLSAGMGYRSAALITDNYSSIMANNKTFYAYGDLLLGDNLLEKAFTGGVGLYQTFKLGRDNYASVSIDYFLTRMTNTVAVDLQANADYAVIFNSRTPSFTHTWQIDFSWQPVERLDIKAAARFNKTRVNLLDGFMVYRTGDSYVIFEDNGRRGDRPLIANFKALLNVQYATKFRLWVFDLTATLNGRSRYYERDEQNAVVSRLSPVYPLLMAQVTRKIKKMDIYLGCENITGYRQKHPIAGADNPYSKAFDASQVWGPITGRHFYIGFRLNVY